MIMQMDILIMIFFIVGFSIITIIWSQIQLRTYEKQSGSNRKINFYLRKFTSEAIELVGTGEDKNSDVEVAKAITLLNLSDTIRIEPYYEEE